MIFGKRLYFLLLLMAAAGACTRVAPPLHSGRAQAARPVPARDAISRAEVLKIAQSYASAAWQCSPKNADARYNRMRPGKTIQGVAYNWGGWDTIEAFQKKIKSGAVAGTTRKEVHRDFAGVDCSGFVSRCWGLTRRRYSTWDIHKISKKIAWKDLKPGDIMNWQGHHVRLFEKYDPNNPDLVWVYEATGDSRGRYGAKVDPPRVIHRCVIRSTMEAEGYQPLRYVQIVDDPAPGKK